MSTENPSPKDVSRSAALRTAVNKALHLAHVLKEYQLLEHDGFGHTGLTWIETTLEDANNRIKDLVRDERARLRKNVKYAPRALNVDIKVEGEFRMSPDASERIADAVAAHEDEQLRNAIKNQGPWPTPADVARALEQSRSQNRQAARS